MLTKDEKIKAFNTKKLTVENPEKITTTDIIKEKADQTTEVRKDKEKQLKEKEKQDKLQAEKEQAALTLQKQRLEEIQREAGNAVQPYTDFIKKLPSPGGILTVFIILVFFLLAVIPVNENGDTRLKLIYLSLTSKTHLNYTEQTTKFVPTQQNTNTNQDTTVSQSILPQSNGTFELPSNINLLSLLGITE